jgi:hypothetical protein
MRMNVYPTSIHQKDGLQLRDLFAAEAMKPLITIIDTDPTVADGDDFRDKVALAAYLIADAMMKARTK